jgi:3'-phosphoadenosine 5'-phosphosulfate sulfotransferase (PAPS reductase)/FAD synthetase
MADLVRKKGMFPNRIHRYCTAELKIRPINNFMAEVDPEWRAIVALGIRADESKSRADALEWEHDGNDTERWTWRPLVRWTLDDVIAIHKRHGITPNPLYLRGASRVGCWPCIHARKSELRMVANESPDRISEIRQLEYEVAEARAQKMLDPAFAQKTQERKVDFGDPTFFNTTEQSSDGKRTGRSFPIDEAVGWSTTAHGGKQIELFDRDPDKGCMRWGLCETHQEEPATSAE